jgi:hypothetical protein
MSSSTLVDLHIYRIAKFFVEKYGVDLAPIMAEKRADVALQFGQTEGQRVWTAVLRAVQELLRTEPRTFSKFPGPFIPRRPKLSQKPPAATTKSMAVSTAIAMADDPMKRIPKDIEFVSFENDDEIEYWTMKFGVSRENVARAVARVGRCAEVVEEYLKRTGPYPRDDKG